MEVEIKETVTVSVKLSSFDISSLQQGQMINLKIKETNCEEKEMYLCIQEYNNES